MPDVRDKFRSVKPSRKSQQILNQKRHFDFKQLKEHKHTSTPAHQSQKYRTTSEFAISFSRWRVFELSLFWGGVRGGTVG